MLLREKAPEGPSVFHVVAELVPCGTSPCMVFGCLSGICECLEASLGLEPRGGGSGLIRLEAVGSAAVEARPGKVVCLELDWL